MKTRNVIRDGYAKRGYVKPLERIHDGMQFEYRPMLPEQVMALDDQCERARNNADGGQALLLADAVAKQLCSWSECDDDGPVEITTETCSRLPVVLLKDLHYVIAGVIPSDPLPAGNGSQATDRVKAIRQQLEQTPGQNELLEQQGN